MLVQLKKVDKIFSSEGFSFQALKKVSLNIAQGEFVSIIGPSGSGKSTLMNILGLLDKPTHGQYLLEGQDTSKLSQDKLASLRNKKIGFVFQSFNLLSRTSALDNVALPLVYSGLSKSEREQLAKEALEAVGLGDKLNSKPNQLSGGQQQRVAIARALVSNPQIILADEPTGNLDSKTGTEIINMFKDINKSGRTVILITHDPEIAKNTKRKIVIKDGEVV